MGFAALDSLLWHYDGTALEEEAFAYLKEYWLSFCVRVTSKLRDICLNSFDFQVLITH